jgi:hypothetical protein
MIFFQYYTDLLGHHLSQFQLLGVVAQPVLALHLVQLRQGQIVMVNSGRVNIFHF